MESKGLVEKVRGYWLTKDAENNIRPNQDIGLAEILNYLNAGALTDVLDFGCGHGHLAESIPPDSYLGVDISAERIQKNSEKYPKHQWHHINTHFDLRELSMEWGVVVLNNVLHHVHDDEIRDMLITFRLLCRRMVVATHVTEGHKFQRDKRITNWNRTLQEYLRLFRETGWIGWDQKVVHNPHYHADFYIIHSC